MAYQVRRNGAPILTTATAKEAKDGAALRNRATRIFPAALRKGALFTATDETGKPLP